MAVNWQSDRAQINHNWLQNGVLVALGHASGVVGGAVRVGNVHRTLTEDTVRWLEHRAKLFSLLGRFENEMSPKVYFDTLPLCRCSAEVKDWLTRLVHELWLLRENVPAKIDAAREAYAQAESMYSALSVHLDRLATPPFSADLSPVERALRDFTLACETLSKTISALPHEIRAL